MKDQINKSSLIYKLRSNAKIKQIALLYAVNILGIPLGLLTSIIITRYLGAELYGDYQFIISIFSLAIIVFNFGFFQAGNRAIVLNNKPQKNKEYYGAVLVFLGLIFLIMTICLFIYANFDSNLKSKNIQSLFMWLIPFGWILLLLKYFETLFQADNKIKLLAWVRFLPKLIFLIAAILVYYYISKYNFDKLKTIWTFYLGSQLIVYLIVLLKLNISFKNILKRVKQIFGYNKTYGFDVYLGSVLAVGLAQLSRILIGYFDVDNAGVGYYSLALTIAAPLSFIPNTIATTYYKEFSKLDAIPKKVLYITLGVTLITFIISWLLIAPFVNYFYGEIFNNVIYLFYLVSIGITFHGFADFYNRFLGAHGLGKMLRNSSILVGISLLITSLIFIPTMNEFGAAIALIISDSIYLITILIYYVKFKKTQIVY